MNAPASAKPKDPKQEFQPIHFDPRPLFSPLQMELSSSGGFPAHLPVSFVLTPEVERGNINLKVRDVEFKSPPPNPNWTFRDGIVNGVSAVSIVMEDNLGDLLLLTGKKTGGDTAAKGTWYSKVLGSEAEGEWSCRQVGGISPFSSRFSWSFLLEPPESATEEGPETVILEFDILVGECTGILQQLSSFPPDWEAKNFQTSNGVSLDLIRTDTQETYILEQGLFTGGLGALVCQGNMPISRPGSTVLDGGTWTGTSGLP